MKNRVVALAILFLFSAACLCGCSARKAEPLPDDSVLIQGIETTPILFHGLSIYMPDREIEVEIASPSVLFALQEKYEGTYYAYGNGVFQGSYTGAIVERGLDYSWNVRPEEALPYSPVVSLVPTVKTPYPRTPKQLPLTQDFIPAVTEAIEGAFSVPVTAQELLAIDLDNCGADEYILYAANDAHFSYYLCLLDKDYNIVSYLMAVTTSEDELAWAQYVLGDDPYEYPLAEKLEIIDCDGDGVMEIFCRLPIYEGFLFHVYKYNRGNFNGKFVNECHRMP